MSGDREVTPSTDDSVQRIAAALRTALRLSGLSLRTCERELGLSTGYLTRILNGEVHLRVGVVLDLCRMLDLPPASLFAALFPAPPASEAISRLLRGLSAVHPQAHPMSIEDALLQLRGAVADLEARLGRSVSTAETTDR